MYQAGDRCVPSRIIVLMPSSRKAIIRISSSSARPGLESAITENSELDIDLTFFPAERRFRNASDYMCAKISY